MTLIRKNDILGFRHKITDIFDEMLEHSFHLKDGDLIKPKVNLSETETHYFLEFEIAGVKKEDIKVTFDNNVLVVSAVKKDTSEEKTKNFHKKEHFFGTFERAVEMPNVEENSITADFKDGILKIKLEKLKNPKTLKQIKIN